MRLHHRRDLVRIRCRVTRLSNVREKRRDYWEIEKLSPTSLLHIFLKAWYGIQKVILRFVRYIFGSMLNSFVRQPRDKPRIGWIVIR
ncbi:hypothetical protein PUN28_017648 [Cardiocondyla obscurior]|uniref:Uncharacterized protein n=1 Tax=Cardiocondyla obscurior TaxID=286306 RepID=A0AAW2EMB9_9HYME